MKKTAKNDITGDFIKSKPSSDMFEENFDRIFRKSKTLDPIDKPMLNGILREEQKFPRIDTIGQNGNDGIHYEYELDKSTGEVIKKDTNG